MLRRVLGRVLLEMRLHMCLDMRLELAEAFRHLQPVSMSILTMHTYMRTRMHTYMRTRIQTYMRTRIHTYMRTWIHYGAIHLPPVALRTLSQELGLPTHMSKCVSKHMSEYMPEHMPECMSKRHGPKHRP